MQKSFCPACGKRVSAKATVCKACGADVLIATALMPAPDAPTVKYKPPAKARTGARTSSGASAAQTRIMEDLRSATLGDYEIIAELGRGGMATVFLAHDISLDRKVAIKVMSPVLLDGEGAVERFKREARTAGALSHPHIIPIHSVRESGDLLYFVMKFVEGRSLESVIREQGRLPIEMVVQILSQVAGALAHAHRKGVVHRDVKPANIMLDDDGWAVVTDFGIAKLAQAHGLTMTGTMVGTPAYMSPEQCLAQDVTGTSDQYSLGIVAYELLTGRVPFIADSMMGMFLAHVNNEPPPLLETSPDCPPLLAQIVERMIAKNPEDRWPTLDDVVAALGELQGNSGERTRGSMSELARVGDGRPRASGFARPISPTPLSRRTREGAAQEEAAEGAAGGWMPLLVWIAIAIPMLAIVAWLALSMGDGPVNTPADSVRPVGGVVAGDTLIDTTSPSPAAIPQKQADTTGRP